MKPLVKLKLHKRIIKPVNASGSRCSAGSRPVPVQFVALYWSCLSVAADRRGALWESLHHCHLPADSALPAARSAIHLPAPAGGATFGHPGICERCTEESVSLSVCVSRWSAGGFALPLIEGILEIGCCRWRMMRRVRTQPRGEMLLIGIFKFRSAVSGWKTGGGHRHPPQKSPVEPVSRARR